MARSQWVIALGLMVGLGGTAIAQAAPNTEGRLDHSQWKIKITPDEAAKRQGEKAGRDALVFRDGKLISKGCGRYGFGPSTYTANQSGSTWTFNTEQTSPNKGNTSWSGQISGNTITGTMLWTKKNGNAIHYSFAGQRARPFWTKLTHLFSKTPS